MFIPFDSVILRIYPDERFRDGLKYLCARTAKCIGILKSRKRKEKKKGKKDGR